MHLEEGLNMVKKAVSLRPNDGYIVDSLGWAYYKLGKFEQGRRRTGACRRAEAGRRDDQRSPRRRLLAGRTQARGDLPVEPGADIQARRGPGPPDQGEDQERPACAGERPPGKHRGGNEERRTGRNRNRRTRPATRRASWPAPPVIRAGPARARRPPAFGGRRGRAAANRQRRKPMSAHHRNLALPPAATTLRRSPP